MNTNRNSAHQSNNEDNFATFSLGLDFLNQAEKEQNTPSRFASLSESEMDQILKERHSNKTKQMTNCSISAFKCKLKFFCFKLLHIYICSCSWKSGLPRTIASEYCCPFFASDLLHNSTGYVIKQLVHAFSCALSSYGALGKFGEHSRS